MKTLTNFLILLFVCLFISCKKNDASVGLLRQAQDIADSKPDDALVLLDSIQNPESMGTDNYMQYIVARVQAKQRAKQDITNDTLIFEAKQYFEKKKNIEQSALAYYYAGRIYYAKDISDKALKCFLQAESYAEKSNKNALAGKSLHVIGRLYYEQGIIDTALVIYKKALNYYNKEKEENTDVYKAQVITAIGASYDEIGNIDSSYVYFKKGLAEAERLGNDKLTASLSNNLGYTYFLMKDYDKAQHYLNSALIQASDTVLLSKIYINLSFLYDTKNQPDSAKYYMNLGQERLLDIKNNYTLRDLYSYLVDVLKKAGDYKQALHYKEQEDSIKEVIAKNERPLSLMNADKNFYLAQKDKEVNKLRTTSCLSIWVGVILVVLAVIIVAILFYRVNKKDKEEIRLQEEKYRNIKNQLIAMGAEYKEIEAEIAAMLKDDEVSD
ncbi:tetratricopeptide repeat protein [Dysgonomonas alginatilytica]|uniref:Tetratricopeptide repeat protein n=1 Tax=Dysgonomonas alginatilytica TaxID=1605892 RepID=A0A2V3PMV6_9BACT|nr:tetratricopeptide repeat protein [Dysgonomonas alginatilytica]PXV62248.1 tetratricopeptide repeat protein [Dysgonomonas alginatilytica]